MFKQLCEDHCQGLNPRVWYLYRSCRRPSWYWL